MGCHCFFGQEKVLPADHGADVSNVGTSNVCWMCRFACCTSHMVHWFTAFSCKAMNLHLASPGEGLASRFIYKNCTQYAAPSPSCQPELSSMRAAGCQTNCGNRVGRLHQHEEGPRFIVHLSGRVLRLVF